MLRARRLACAGRAHHLACRLREAIQRGLPATDRRRGLPRPTQPAAPRLAGAVRLRAHARRKPVHARRFGRLPRVPPRLHRLSQLHTQRADEAPAFSPDRSLSGRSQLQCSRPADLRLLRSQPAHGAAGLCAAAPSRTLQPGGQRSHRTKADRGSQPSASVGTRPVRLDRRGRARAAAERRAGRRVQRSCQRDDDFHKFDPRLQGINTVPLPTY